MKSFFLPIGQSAGASLPTLLSAMSCGATVPVTGMDILHITDCEADPVLPPLVRDINQIHSLLLSPDNDTLFPSSFSFRSFRPRLPSLLNLSADAASAALLSALRGKGIPLSYKTDREAVDWAVSVLLSDKDNEEFSPFHDWIRKICDCISSGEQFRIAVLCDLCDPFSSGTAFSILRYFHNEVKTDPSSLALFCLAVKDEKGPVSCMETLSGVLHSLEYQTLAGRPDRPGSGCADSVWLLSLPSCLIQSAESFRILYAVLARNLAGFFSPDKVPAPGLHITNLPGTLTFHELGGQAKTFASFIHASAWLLSDLIPALNDYTSHPAPLRSLAPNTRNGMFRRLFHGKAASPEQLEMLRILKRAFSAVLTEILALIRFLPDQLRLSEISDQLWQQITEACGRTVTVASEYAVSRDEAEEGGILNIKPVHRVSLADTEEEKAERRLDDIAAQLKSEEETRNRLFATFGGSWAYIALLNCRERCQNALVHARKQSAEQSGDPEADRLSVAALSRRIRLLEAAVACCDTDLSSHDLFSGNAGHSSGIFSSPSPYSSQLLNTAASEKLFLMLNSSDDSAETSRKEVLSLMPALLFGFSLSDTKSLFRNLLSVVSPDIAEEPFARLVLSVLQVSRKEVQPLRFLSSGEAPSVPLLPDLYSAAPLLTVSALLPLLPSTRFRSAEATSDKRGLLAMLLLRQYRRKASEEASLSFDYYHAGDSPVLRAWLASQRADTVCIVSLGRENFSLPFALILPGSDLLPARITASHGSLLPDFASPWFNGENLSFMDPCSLMGMGDRTVLTEQLSRIRDTCDENGPVSLCSFLDDFIDDLLSARESTSLPGRFDLRLKAAFGLRLLPAFQKTLLSVSCSYEHSIPSDRIAACLLDQASFVPSSCNVPEDIVFLYRDVPFARENPRTLLEAIPLPSETWILNLLDQECQTLSRVSDDYHDTLVRELSLLLSRYPEALPEARRIALDLLESASQPVTDSDTELIWPWDPVSPSVITILAESLGDTLAASAVCPFSDILTLFPARGAEVIGDSLMASMCVLPPVSSPAEQDNAPSLLPDAVLPPLSPEFCSSLCRVPEGRTAIRQNLLSFERTDSGSVRVTMTLEGRFTIRLVRIYSGDDIIHMYAHDIPTLAVWPNLPFPAEDWHAYFIYAGLPSPLRIIAYTAEGEACLEEGLSRTVSRSDAFPLSFSFFRDGKSIGAIPNLLPAPVIDKSDPYTACIDFGSAGTSVIFSAGHRRLPLQGPTLVRTLINNPAHSRDLLRKEFLPAVPVSALLPTASRIFRNKPGAAPLPFEDGIILMASDLQDVLSIPSGALYTCLKWEEEKGRSVSLCLHQIMLMTALQARADGASALFWRFSVPDEMARTGRERLVSLFSSLADLVNRESGFMLPDKQPLVTYASESSALGAYFRFCAHEDTRGGFMVLDIGACTADISLFLRGREQAVRTCQIPLGIHYILLPSLLRDPGLLQQDLGYIQDPSFRQDLVLLEQIIRSAKADPAALRHSRLALDNFIADRYASLLPGLLINPATGMPSYLGSLLLLHFSFLMMLSGLILLQIAADPGKNDFLPEQMSLCLSGRGSLLPEYLPDQYKTALWHFLTMFRNRRVASLSLLFSSEKKMEIPVGLSLLEEVTDDLPPASAVPAAISVRPEELLPQFLLRFAKEFPSCAEILFKGFFSGDFYHPFTPYGESLVTEAISQSFTEQTALRPFDALSSWIGSLLDLIFSGH